MQTFGRYELLEQIGAGGMAEIWKARAVGPEGFSKILAIKKILPELVENPQFVELLTREARLAADLVHPNIVQAFDFGKVGEREWFIAMEYVAGANLSSFLSRVRDEHAELSPEIAVYIASEICRALAYAHSKTGRTGRELGIVHRDVSPENVLVTFQGEAKLSDFGIAKITSELTRTAKGHVKGKFGYMSPEQTAAGKVDRRSDLFSLGLVLYETMTGERFFRGRTVPEVIIEVGDFRGPTEAQLEKVPKIYRVIFERALAPDLGLRYQSAREMETVLATVLGPDAVVLARHALSSVIQRLFAKEWRKEAAPDSTGAQTDPTQEVQTTAPVVVGSLESEAPISLAEEPKRAVRPTPRPVAVVEERPRRRRWPWILLAAGSGLALALLALEYRARHGW